jgi:hypothetical protein
MESPKIDLTEQVVDNSQDFKLTVSKRKRKESNNLEIEQDDEMMAEDGEDETKKLKFPPVSVEKLTVSEDFCFVLN